MTFFCVDIYISGLLALAAFREDESEERKGPISLEGTRKASIIVVTIRVPEFRHSRYETIVWFNAFETLIPSPDLKNQESVL